MAKFNKFILIFTFVYYDISNAINTNEDPCLINVENSIINLNNFKTSSGYEINYDRRTFLLNICGTTNRCGHQNISVCEIDPITKQVKHILGYYNNLSILTSYKPIPALKYQTNGKRKTKVEIQFKCNPRINNNKITLITPQLGRKYKFLFETKNVCLKHQMNCLINNKHNNIQYDLTSLYKKNGNWEVKNSTEKIYLNMCGKLNKISSKYYNECSYENTQICEITKNDVSKSLGTVSSNFLSTYDMITIIFKDGSFCSGNNQTETKIDFYCSTNEKYPQLLSTSLCKYHIIWNTPAACPNFVSHGTNCEIYDPFYGSRNLRDIFENNEITKRISNDVLINLNICDNLFSPCGYFNNASVCLKYRNKPYVLGWTNNNVISKNGFMSMQLFGDLCVNGKDKTITNIKFECSNSFNTQINLSNDLCKANIKIHTKLACIDNSQQTNCTLLSNNLKYDLTPLISNSNNYEIQDRYNRNIKYFINICKPINFKTNVICDKFSSVCARNDSEPNLTKRFKSLGSFAVSSVPFLENNYLKIRYNAGICTNPNISHLHVFTEIKFICAQQSNPTLISNDECYYLFEWRTPFACAQNI